MNLPYEKTLITLPFLTDEITETGTTHVSTTTHTTTRKQHQNKQQHKLT